MRKLLVSAFLTLALVSGTAAVITIHSQPAMACQGSNCG
jgi:hypothetical protein